MFNYTDRKGDMVHFGLLSKRVGLQIHITFRDIDDLPITCADTSLPPPIPQTTTRQHIFQTVGPESFS